MHGHGLRRHAVLVVSVGLVVLMGGVGLIAGRAAGDLAMQVHRQDRLDSQRLLAELLDQYTQTAALELFDRLRGEERAGLPAYSATSGSTADTERIKALASGSRAMGAGVLLLGADRELLVSFSPTGLVPGPDDLGWAPLLAAAASGRLTAPVSGLLFAGTEPVTAVAVPVRLSDGTTGWLVGLALAREGGLQRYLGKLGASGTRRGYVVDGSGIAISAPQPNQIGKPLPFPAIAEQVRAGGSGVLETVDGGHDQVSVYATGDISGWTMLTVQDRAAFVGGLERSSRRAQAALVALLLLVGSSLVLLHRKRESALSAMALRDELTGLHNRRGWFARAEQELQRAARQGEERVLLFVDVDGLKQVNDLLGHRQGDQVIVAAADVLRRSSRGSDVLGRLGGDEFVLLLCEQTDLLGIRGRVLETLARHNADSAVGFELRLSLGAHVWHPGDPCGLDELVRRADAVMYLDKADRPGRSDGVLRVPEQGSGEQRVPIV